MLKKNFPSSGADGEAAAARFLQKKGWLVLDRNWRHKSWELDLVCRDGDSIVFVEVKTRADGGLTEPADALTPEKKRRLVKAARCWLAAHDAWALPCRFDLVGVTLRNGEYLAELACHVIELDAGNSLGSSHTSWQPW